MLCSRGWGRCGSATAGVLAMVVVSLGLASCGKHGAPPKVESNLHTLMTFYGRYTAQHQGQRPSDADALKKYIGSQSPDQLAKMEITDVDSLFVSPRDGQPYVMRYGVLPPPATPLGGTVVAYEQTGVDGKRYVGFDLGSAEEVDETRFRTLVPDATGGAAAAAPEGK